MIKFNNILKQTITEILIGLILLFIIYSIIPQFNIVTNTISFVIMLCLVNTIEYFYNKHKNK